MAMRRGRAHACLVNVDLLLVSDCPHGPGAHRLLRSALDDVGLGRIPIQVTVVETGQDAERRGFRGSPTILLDGRDPFEQPGNSPALACRIYGTASGLPELRELRQALKRAAAEGHPHE